MLFSPLVEERKFRKSQVLGQRPTSDEKKIGVNGGERSLERTGVNCGAGLDTGRHPKESFWQPEQRSQAPLQKATESLILIQKPRSALQSR